MEQALTGLNIEFKNDKNNTKDKMVNKREVINIPDCNLKTALNKKFNSPEHSPVTRGQLESLLALNLTEMNIRSLEGIQYCTNLSYLGLSKNEISELSPLCDLKELVTLNLDENKINDLTYLKKLTNLTYLTLSGNELKDLSPIQGLTNLNYLDLSKNKINDLSHLSGITNLVCLNLNKNRISDLSPLDNLNNLGFLDLKNQEIILDSIEISLDSTSIEIENNIVDIDGSFIAICDKEIKNNGIYSQNTNKIKWSCIVDRLEYNFYIKKMINSKKSEFSGKVVLPYTYRTAPINNKSTNGKNNDSENVKNPFNVLFSITNIFKKVLHLIKDNIF
ncbi:leucine-rich repeat domain-containing protein (plasmid) [Paraclostridium ghonii]|uniref:leucine-rich repeat domain-containing protein n=1 Tax=Paraclostridium ghonii TaxID=29358 RepID=UPI00202CB440|nr:leucine-rich repeat domain-containing protein [Paeniclostridium ghonii]MCM0166745.1 leucine-rich repeat domain-containing protein [Paeniclostridium ghonii]